MAEPSPMDALGFRWKIGDIAAHRGELEPYTMCDDGSLPSWAKAMGGRNEPTRVVILGRVADECPGGLQKHYRVRPVSWQNGFTRDLFQVHEEELVAYPVKPEPAKE